MKFLIAVFVGSALLFSACNKDGGSAADKEVRAALNAHLQKKGNLALNNMNMDIQSVKVTGDTAEAQVRFQSKQKAELAVSIRYVLHRVGDHWEVQSSTPTGGMGGDPHQSSGMAGDAGSASPQAPSETDSPKPEASH
jgi:hypothetical protein